MKNSYQYSQAMDEIAKYLSGELEGLQKEVFEEKLESDDDLRSEFLETKAIWDQMDNLIAGKVDDVNTDNAWSNVMNRIQEDKEIKSPGKIYYFLPSLLRVAAAVLFLAGVGWLAMLNYKSKQENMLVFENTSDELVSAKTLNDGSMVYLAQQSQIMFSETFGTQKRIVELTGEAFFDVAHDNGKPFIIKTGAARIEVLGTSFNVKSYKNSDFELYVESGKVKVTFASGASSFVEPGQLLSLRDGKSELAITAGYNTHWRRNLLHFRDEKLGDILYMLGKTYGVNFETSEESLNNRRMTLTIYDSSIHTISELISLSLGIGYELKSDSIVVFGPK
jgi:ferric-dicitrate binding protein FerR (iron transport regulator)